MILADTSVWIDHLRGSNDALRVQLVRSQICIHPYIVAELALGSLRDRIRTLAELEMLPQVQVATLSEVRRLINAQSLFGKGIGLIDAHLIASTLIAPATRLWTRDKRLREAGESSGILAKLM